MFNNELFDHEDETVVIYGGSDTKVFSYMKWWVSLFARLENKSSQP